ncbi:hypothetical protein [Yersinia bercovieri]|nr:hypothetical protein [Yersinia bercovieri]
MHTKQYYETIGFNLGLDACKADWDNFQDGTLLFTAVKPAED